MLFAPLFFPFTCWSITSFTLKNIHLKVSSRRRWALTYMDDGEDKEDKDDDDDDDDVVVVVVVVDVNDLCASSSVWKSLQCLKLLLTGQLLVHVVQPARAFFRCSKGRTEWSFV